MVKSAAIGASIAALTVLTGSLLAPQAASALDFNFSFAGVTGLIQNLVAGTLNTCDGTTVCVVTVDEPASVANANGTYTKSVGSGFFVSGAGELTDANWNGTKVGGGATLVFARLFVNSEEVGNLLVVGGGLGEFGLVTFAAVQPPQPPASSVPGPLPLFGAATAFGFSRKLRNRIKVTRTTAPTRPAG